MVGEAMAVAIPAASMSASDLATDQLLIGGLSTVVGLLISARVPRLTLQVGYDPRFSHGDYGVWVECAPEQARTARVREE